MWYDIWKRSCHPQMYISALSCITEYVWKEDFYPGIPSVLKPSSSSCTSIISVKPLMRKLWLMISCHNLFSNDNVPYFPNAIYVQKDCNPYSLNLKIIFIAKAITHSFQSKHKSFINVIKWNNVFYVFFTMEWSKISVFQIDIIIFSRNADTMQPNDLLHCAFIVARIKTIQLNYYV